MSITWLAVCAIVLSCVACDKDGDPATRARRKELCPDLDTWSACAARLEKTASDVRQRLEAEQKAKQLADVAAGEKAVASAWATYDATPTKTKPAFFAAYTAAIDALKSVAGGPAANLRTTLDADARLRMAPLIQPETRTAGELNAILVPSPNAAKCRLWGAMWVADDETFDALEKLGFLSVGCNDHSWDLAEEARTCFLYPTITDDIDDARGGVQAFYPGGAVLVWKSLNAFQKAQELGPQTSQNARMAFVGITSQAQVVVPGTRFVIVQRGDTAFTVQGRGKLAGVSGYVEPSNCSRKKH